MRGDLIKIFKITNEISNHGSDTLIFFNISLQTGNLLSRQISKTKSTNQLDLDGFRKKWLEKEFKREFLGTIR